MGSSPRKWKRICNKTDRSLRSTPQLFHTSDSRHAEFPVELFLKKTLDGATWDATSLPVKNIYSDIKASNGHHPTTAPVQWSDINSLSPEFTRVPGVEKVFGIKRGVTYRKIKDGTFKSMLLREPGNQQGVRLVYLQSVRDFLHSQMALQEAESTNGAATGTDEREEG